MKEFLERIKLIQYLTTEIEIQKNEFVDRFRLHIDEGDTGLFSNLSDIFSSSKNEYKGEVKFDRFRIKRRKRLFETSFGSAIASGKFRQEDNKLIIETEINAFHSIMIPFYVLVIAMYLIVFVAFLLSDSSESSIGFMAAIFILFHGALMMSIPYFIMRRSAKRMKYDLEREFYYIAKKE